VIIVLWLLASTAGLTAYVNAHQDLHTAPTRAYTVQQGDSVWTIAETVDRQHTGYVVDEILKSNGLWDATVEPGDVIQIPVEVGE
jgi:LysM repeat protein